ncbi:hypothetical protein PspLS_01488 [Pyricularia sp. CBS 133598]|nr:hypothetical protein PspLS_01488 [Pyricularia sp. CBS 133598]
MTVGTVSDSFKGPRVVVWNRDLLGVARVGVAGKIGVLRIAQTGSLRAHFTTFVPILIDGYVRVPRTSTHLRVLPSRSRSRTRQDLDRDFAIYDAYSSSKATSATPVDSRKF